MIFISILLFASLIDKSGALEEPRFNLDSPPIVPTRPSFFEPETFDTIAVSQHTGIHEAVLQCGPKVSSVNHIVICDIFTFDDCGHPRGSDISNISGWQPSARMKSPPFATNELVSSISVVKRGQFRYYFTPTIAGQYESYVAIADHTLIGAGRKLIKDTVVVVQETEQCSDLKGFQRQGLMTLTAFHEKEKEISREITPKPKRKRDQTEKPSIDELTKTRKGSNVCDEIFRRRRPPPGADDQ